MASGPLDCEAANQLHGPFLWIVRLLGGGGARVSESGPEPPLVRVISSVDHSQDHSTGDTAQGIGSFCGCVVFDS